MKPKLIIVLLSTALVVQGCAMNRSARSGSTGQTVRDAAMQPLSDIGVIKPKIQPQVARILDDPYAVEANPSCARLSVEIIELNKALGPDFDIDVDDPSTTRKRANGALRLAGKMGAGMLLPFRGVIREITGSAENEREFRAATLIGVARRSYLKGRAVEKGCQVPVRMPNEDELEAMGYETE
ncbi:MAG: hypothetical protein WA979_09085 [Pacificimonas sp.]